MVECEAGFRCLFLLFRWGKYFERMPAGKLFSRLDLTLAVTLQGLIDLKWESEHQITTGDGRYKGAKKVGVWKLAILFAGCFAFLERGQWGCRF